MIIFKIYKENDRIYLKPEDVDKLAYTNYSDELWQIINDTNWTITKDKNNEPKYLLSNKFNKTLHQIVIDHFFGESVRKQAYEAGMIIEHLNNNGFDCMISNLYFLIKIKNTYKGWYFDKLAEESIDIIALRIFHIMENHTFQITIAFNQPFVNKANEGINTLKFLYDYDYCEVLQDAESMLESIVSTKQFSIDKFKQKYRFKDYKIELAPKIELTEEEKTLQAGNIIWRNGVPYIIQGDTTRFRIESASYEKDWQ